MSNKEIEKLKYWNSIIERILSVDKDCWKIEPPKFEKHFNRIYGGKLETIWLKFDGFEIGVYPFAGAINFGVQINVPSKHFYIETTIPIPEKHTSYLSKGIRWTIRVLIDKIEERINPSINFSYVELIRIVQTSDSYLEGLKPKSRFKFHPPTGEIYTLENMIKKLKNMSKEVYLSFAKIDFKCPHCEKEYIDDNDEYVNRCNKSKSGNCYIKCECGERFGMTYSMTGEAVSFTDFE